MTVWFVAPAGGRAAAESPVVQSFVLRAQRYRLLLDPRMPAEDCGIISSLSYLTECFCGLQRRQRGKFSPGGDKLPPDPIFYSSMM